MGYIAAQYRIRLDIPRSEIIRLEKPPEDLFIRAEKKLQAEQKAKNIKFYEIHKDRITLLWKKARDYDIAVDGVVSYTLANASPFLRGVLVQRVEDSDGLCGYLALRSPPELLQKWRFQLVYFYIQAMLYEQGFTGRLDPAYVMMAFIRGERGIHVKSAKLYAVPQPLYPKKGYEIYSHDAEGFIGLSVTNVKSAARVENLKKILVACQQELQRKQLETGMRYQLQKDEIVRRIRSAARGPEKYGFDLPVTMLAAYQPNKRVAAVSAIRTASKAKQVEATTSSTATVVQENTEAPQAEAQAAAEQPQTPRINPKVQVLHNYINVLPDEGKMSATITEFNPEIYEKEKIKLNNALWKDFCIDSDIVHGVDTKFTNVVIKKWDAGGDLKGIKIAQGTPPIHPDAPFLYPAWKNKLEGTYKRRGEASEEAAATPESDASREQKRPYAIEGELVAELRYGAVAANGSDVEGNVIAHNAPPDLNVEIGDGIRQDGELFYATFAGVPKIEGGTIRMEKVLIIEENLTIDQSPITFDGKVHIKANIEEGAELLCNGDVTVDGCIYGGHLIINGNLKAKEGIRHAPGSWLKTKGSITTGFIETSEIECEGDITVEKSILNSYIIASGEVKIKDGEGVLGGGETVCGRLLELANLGMDRGSDTVVRVGCDMKGEKSVKVRKQRIESLKRAESQWNELLSSLKEKTRLNKTEREIKLKTKKKLRRLPEILKRLERVLDKKKSSLNFNKDATIIVKDLLSTNAVITLGGKRIPVRDDVKEVSVHYEEKNGTNIRSTKKQKKAENDKEASSDDAGGEDKKAS